MKQPYMYKEAIMNTVVNIENLVKRYKELLALDHLNLSINEGEIFGLLGPNGSGKTTVIDALYFAKQLLTGHALSSDAGDYIAKNAEEAVFIL